MQICGWTIIKNAIDNHYPIDLWIRQHFHFFDKMIIGVAKTNSDNTLKLTSDELFHYTQRMDKSDIVLLDWGEDHDPSDRTVWYDTNTMGDMLLETEKYCDRHKLKL